MNMEHYDWELKHQLNNVFDVAMLLIDVLLRTSSFVFFVPTSKTFNGEVWQHDSTQSVGFRMKQMSSTVCTSVFFWLVRCDPLIYICRGRNYVLKHASFPFDLCVSVCLEAQSFSASVELAMSHLDQDDVRPSPSGREERDQLNRIERDIKDPDIPKKVLQWCGRKFCDGSWCLESWTTEEMISPVRFYAFL